MKINRYILVTALGIPLLALSARAEAALESVVAAHVQSLSDLALAQEANRAKIVAYSLVMNEHSEIFSVDDGAVQHITMDTVHEETREGNCSIVKRARRSETDSMGGTTMANDELRMVVSDTCLVHWYVSTEAAYLYEFESQETWSREARNMAKAMNPRTPERYGFGDGFQTLRQLYELVQASEGELSVTVSNDEAGMAVVKVIDAANGSELSTLWVDPAKGALICRAVHKDGDVLLGEITAEPKEIVEGVWFPARWEDIQYTTTPESHGQPYVTRHSVNEVTKIEIIPQQPAASFTLEALELRDGVFVIRANS